MAATYEYIHPPPLLELKNNAVLTKIKFYGILKQLNAYAAGEIHVNGHGLQTVYRRYLRRLAVLTKKGQLNMAELKYIPFYPGYMEDTSDLSDSEFRRLMYALAAFCNGEEPPEPLTGKEVIAYRFITRNIRVAQDQYNAKCKANSENAKKRPQANANDRKRTLAKPAKTKNKEQKQKII